MSQTQMILLGLLTAAAVVLAAPHLRKTYVGAMLSGDCPKTAWRRGDPPQCQPPRISRHGMVPYQLRDRFP